MTKTNLVGVLLAVLMLMGSATTGTTTAYAKSASNIAKTGAVVAPEKVTTIVTVDNLIEYKPAFDKDRRKAAASRPSRDRSNKWMDSGKYDVWRGVPIWIRDLGLCIRNHESIHSGHYKAHNGSSSAAGAYQFLSGTWQGNAKWTKVKGHYVARKYAAANLAPDWVQDAVFIHSIKGGGIKAWHGTWCPGT